jgi:ATP-dependent exoDNAse (exonuclease V) beta subunit
VEAAKPSASGKEGENPDPRVIEAARAYEKALRKVSEAKPRKILSPSSEQEDRVAGDLAGEIVETSVGERQGDRETRMAAGTATHLLLELWDGKDPAWLLENAPRAARAAAGRAGTKVDEVLARVREILAGVEENGRIAELLREKALAREMPILYEDQNGDIWDGTMDLVTGTPEAPRIVDYKTDAASSPEELQLLYAGQLARYSEGLQLALGLKAPPPARVELLRKLEKVNRTRG